MSELLRNFWRCERGAVALEAVIMTPILAFMFTGSFIFFDAFRTYNTSLKATYAVADVMSRQTDTIFASDINGMGAIFEHIARNPAGSRIRVTEVRYDADDDEYYVNWSHATGSGVRLFDESIPGIRDDLPLMARGEVVLLVESWVPYRPAFNVGLSDLEFTNFTVTRPRFGSPIPFDDGDDPTCTACNFGDGEAEPDTGGFDISVLLVPDV